MYCCPCWAVHLVLRLAPYDLYIEVQIIHLVIMVSVIYDQNFMTWTLIHSVFIYAKEGGIRSAKEN